MPGGEAQVAMNPIDSLRIKGVMVQKWPVIVGGDIAGVVEAVGPDSALKVGDKAR